MAGGRERGEPRSPSRGILGEDREKIKKKLKKKRRNAGSRSRGGGCLSRSAGAPPPSPSPSPERNDATNLPIQRAHQTNKNFPSARALFGDSRVRTPSRTGVMRPERGYIRSAVPLRPSRSYGRPSPLPPPPAPPLAAAPPPLHSSQPRSAEKAA